MDCILVGFCAVNAVLIHGLVVQMYLKSSRGLHDLGPPLPIRFGLRGTGGVGQQNPNSVMLHTVTLRVYEITIDLMESNFYGTQDIWNESAWTKFAETALKFPQLQCVKLLHVKATKVADHLYYDRDPAGLEITDEAFKKLIEAGKLTKVAKVTILEDGGGLWSDLESEKVADDSVESNCKHSLFNFMLADTDTRVQWKRKRNQRRLPRKIFEGGQFLSFLWVRCRVSESEKISLITGDSHQPERFRRT